MPSQKQPPNCKLGEHRCEARRTVRERIQHPFKTAYSCARKEGTGSEDDGDRTEGHAGHLKGAPPSTSGAI